jgi:hypothetical protein
MSTAKRRVARTCRAEVIADDLRRIAAVAAADVRRTGGDSRDIGTQKRTIPPT